MSLKQADSLAANEFAVEINGAKVSGIFRIVDFATFHINEDGNSVQLPFVISKMVQRDGNNAFNQWIKDSRAVTDPNIRPLRDLAILAIDDGIEIRRWLVKDAWIKAVEYSEFNSGSFDMVEELITIMYDHIEETWSHSADS